MLYANVMSQLTEVLVVVTSWPLKPYPWPWMFGLLGLMVATTNAGSAFFGIGFGGGSGFGMVHAVSAVARARFRGIVGPPWLQLPEIELPSELTVPS